MMVSCETTSPPLTVDYTVLSCEQLIAEKEIALMNLGQAEIAASTANNQTRHTNPYGQNSGFQSSFNQGAAMGARLRAGKKREAAEEVYANATREIAARPCK